jgi:hypothetical protein
MLIQPEVAGSSNKHNVVVGEPRNNNESNKVSGREIILVKQPNGKKTVKITIKNPALRGQPQIQKDVHAKFIKAKSPEVGKWETNEFKAQGKKIKPTFDMLLSNYVNEAVSSSSNRSSYVKRP